MELTLIKSSSQQLLEAQQAIEKLSARKNLTDMLQGVKPVHEALEAIRKATEFPRSQIEEAIKSATLARAMLYDEEAIKRIEAHTHTFTKAHELAAQATAAAHIPADLLRKLEEQNSPWIKAVKSPKLWGDAYDLYKQFQIATARVAETRIGDYIRFSDPLRTGIIDTLSHFGNSYAELWKKLQKTQYELTEFEPIVFEAPPIEIYQSASLLKTFTRRVEDGSFLGLEEAESTLHDIASGVEIQLVELEPKLLKLYRGAKRALNKPGYDSTRHFAASLRELITHTLHLLCPDEEFHCWNTNADLVHNGRPTRQGRLIFICRSISERKFVKFVQADVKATLEFIDLFHEGTHAIEPSFTGVQLQAMLRRAEGLLSYLIEVGLKRS